VQVRLRGVVDPVPAEVVRRLRVELDEIAVDALGKQVAHVLVTGEEHVRPFVPGEAIPLDAVDVAARVCPGLVDAAAVVTGVIGHAKAGQARTQDGYLAHSVSFARESLPLRRLAAK
jgi:hypothetical protein